MILDWLNQEYFPQLLDGFINPQKRVSLGYLLGAILIALAWSCWVSRAWLDGVKQGLRGLFTRRIWFGTSARADYKLLLINRAVMMFIAPALISKLAVATALFYFMHEQFGTSPAALAGIPTSLVTVAFTLFLFLLDDFSRFAVHTALHRIPVLWAFHKTHHSAETLTPFTVYRTHPVEAVIFSFRAVLVQSVAISLFVFLFGDRFDLLSVYGVNIFLFIFNVTGANLRHSHIPISYGATIERFFISPAQHQIHHSVQKRHHNRNFGAALAIWDGIFGSLCTAERNAPLKFGLSGVPNPAAHGLLFMYLSPFAEIFRYFSAIRRNMTMRTGMIARKQVTPKYRAKIFRLPLMAVAMLAIFPAQIDAAELNVYSHRQPFLINPFLKAFEKKSGVKVNVVFASKGLVQRLLAEGPRSPADLVLTVDIARLDAYADKNLFAPVSSKILVENIPAHLRDTDNRWFGLSKRARVVAIARGRVDPTEITRIEDLADPKWKGRICTRPGSHVYNRALLASLIAANGEQAAEAWARGLVSNLARRPQGNDRAQVKAIYQGVCDIAIINSYYYGKLRTSKVPAQRKWAENIQILFTNQGDRGNHINISGGGVARYSKNKATAVAMLEFLTQQTAQELYGEINYEFPVNLSVRKSSEVESWGSFKEDQLPIGMIATLAPRAQKIIDRVGW